MNTRALTQGRSAASSGAGRRAARTPAPAASRLRGLALVLSLAVAGVFASPPSVRADIMLYPMRIIIGGDQRSGQVEIVNRGQKPETYRVSLVNRRMNEAGEIVAAEAPAEGERFADSMVVYSPRQVTLQPGQSQTVRVSVRRPAELPEGEYRSHLQFERQPDITAQNNLEAVNDPGKGQVAISLEALIGASIPVIVRQGRTSAEVQLADLALIPAQGERPPMLGFVFNRQGNQSVYGDVVATFIPANGKAVEVGKVSGVAVYVPNALRRAQLPLKPPPGVALRGGALKLTYSEPPAAGGRRLAEAQIVLP